MTDYRKDTDLLAVSDPIKNNARGKRGERDLTPNGIIVCNMTAHFMVQLYQFVERLESPSDASNLSHLVRTFGENLPARIIEVCNPEPKDEDGSL